MLSMDEIRSLLMPYSVYRKTQTPVPYFFKIEKGGQHLFFFGSNHSRDPQDEQYSQIKKYWEEFSTLTKLENVVVFNEGRLRKPCDNESEAISLDAEAGLITYLATSNGVQIFSPEPGRRQQEESLLKKYNKEEIQYFYFAQVVHQWGRIQQKPPFEAYLDNFLSSDKASSGWQDFDFSLENMKKIHSNIFPKGVFDEWNTNFFYSITNPSFNTTIINSLSQDETVERDIHVTSKILDHWKDGKNLFVVFGEAHAVMQEPALKKLT